jgi:hypothetical protein
MSTHRWATCHSEKDSDAATFKSGVGYHPLLAFLDNTGEALVGLLHPGNAGSNTAADHIAVTDLALAQIPDTERYGRLILIRADGAGATRDWLAHLRDLRRQNGQHGYIDNKDDYLKRLRRIEGQSRGLQRMVEA